MRCAIALLCGALTVSASLAQAATFLVDALDHSVFNTSGLKTVTLSKGEAFGVSADANDLWSSGPLPRWSNADGLIGDRFATGNDESGEPAGTLIGIDWGVFNFDGFSAPFGSLVGRISGGEYFLAGTSFSGRADAAGTLNLYYWDEYSDDNSGSVAATVSAVPLPMPLYLELSAVVGGVIVVLKRRGSRHKRTGLA